MNWAYARFLLGSSEKSPHDAVADLRKFVDFYLGPEWCADKRRGGVEIEGRGQVLPSFLPPWRRMFDRAFAIAALRHQLAGIRDRSGMSDFDFFPSTRSVRATHRAALLTGAAAIPGPGAAGWPGRAAARRYPDFGHTEAGGRAACLSCFVMRGGCA